MIPCHKPFLIISSYVASQDILNVVLEFHYNLIGPGLFVRYVQFVVLRPYKTYVLNGTLSYIIDRTAYADSQGDGER